MMDEFYTQHKFSRQSAAGSNSPHAQKGNQKYNVYLPKFSALMCRIAHQDFTAKAVKPEGFGLWINRIQALKNSPSIFSKGVILL